MVFRKLKPVTIPSLTDSQLAYFCGAMAGDGNIYVRPEKGDHSISCGGNPTDEVEYYHTVIGPLFCSLFGFEVKLKQMGTTYGFTTRSKSLLEFLTQQIGLPAGPKHPNLRVPPVFLTNEALMKIFVKGVFDTDGCVTFKKKYRPIPYYPVISCSSKTKEFIQQIATFLNMQGFRVYEYYDYKYKDDRVECGYTIKSGIELNGRYNFKKWMQLIGFSNPKHLNKIKEHWIDTSSDRINSRRNEKKSPEDSTQNICIAGGRFEFGDTFGISTDLRVMSPTNTPGCSTLLKLADE